MTANQLVGVVLILTGLCDAIMAVVLPRRMQGAQPKRIVTVSLLAAAALLVVLGAIFLARG